MALRLTGAGSLGMSAWHREWGPRSHCPHTYRMMMTAVRSDLTMETTPVLTVVQISWYPDPIFGGICSPAGEPGFPTQESVASRLTEMPLACKMTTVDSWGMSPQRRTPFIDDSRLTI